MNTNTENTISLTDAVHNTAISPEDREAAFWKQYGILSEATRSPFANHADLDVEKVKMLCWWVRSEHPNDPELAADALYGVVMCHYLRACAHCLPKRDIGEGAKVFRNLGVERYAFMWILSLGDRETWAYELFTYHYPRITPTEHRLKKGMSYVLDRPAPSILDEALRETLAGLAKLNESESTKDKMLFNNPTPIVGDSFDTDVWEELLKNWLRSHTRPLVLVSEIIEQALKMPPSQMKPPELKRLAIIMNKLGWWRVRVFKGYRAETGFQRPENW